MMIENFLKIDEIDEHGRAVRTISGYVIGSEPPLVALPAGYRVDRSQFYLSDDRRRVYFLIVQREIAT